LKMWDFLPFGQEEDSYMANNVHNVQPHLTCGKVYH